MDIEDKELFESTLSEEMVAEEVAAEPVAEAEPEQTGQPRDEHGRFAPKAAEPEPVAEAQPTQTAEPQKEEAHVPSWRLREMREEREAAERRFADREAQWQRQFAELQARLPKAEEAKAPEVWEDPNGFLRHGLDQAINPIRSEINTMREQFSLTYAIDKFGQEKVDAAYQALDKAAKSGDAEAQAVVARVKNSMFPYQDMVKWHEKQSIVSQVAQVGDLNKWFEQELERRMADPSFQAKQLERTQQSIRNPGASVQTITRLPPSLNKVGSAANEAADNDMSDGALFANAIR